MIRIWFGVDVGKKSDIELHIYSVASNSIYGAVAYSKSITSSKSVLQLQAAVTAVRLKDKIVEIFDIQLFRIKFWVDSQIVLKYIQNTNCNFLNAVDWNFIPDTCTTYMPFIILILIWVGFLGVHFGVGLG